MIFFGSKHIVKNYREEGLNTNPKTSNGWYTCAHCGRKFRASDIDVDHIRPRACGGTNDTMNLQILCKHCNRSKGKKMDDTNQDLRKRKVSYNERRRQDVLREEIRKRKKNIRELMKEFPDNDILLALSDENLDSTERTFVVQEARRRGLKS